MVCHRLLSRFAFLFCLTLAGVVAACQVPVFRYALERWEPSFYPLQVDLPSRPLAPVEQTALDQLRHASTISNLRLTEPSLTTTAAPSATAPEWRLYHPNAQRHPQVKPIASGPLTSVDLAALLDSPLRQELRQRLLAGESAVWLLLESGDSAKDQTAFSTLEAGLAAATQQIELPDGVITQAQASQATDPKLKESADILYSDLPLEVRFSTLRLSRQSPSEKALLAMLLNVEPDLSEFADEPMVFAIFGRGRALEPLIGAGISQANVIEAASYLCGACSCEIKEQNPGMDLLLTADWSAVNQAPKIETVTTQAAAPTPSIVIPPDAPLSQKILLILTALGFVAGATWLFRRNG
jgi:hypothetical protein